TGRRLRIFDCSNDGEPGVALLPDGRRAVVSFRPDVRGENRNWILNVEPGSDARQVSATSGLPPLVRPMPGRISSVAVGGGGRYLMLAMPDEKKLAIFDVNAADVVKV